MRREPSVIESGKIWMKEIRKASVHQICPPTTLFFLSLVVEKTAKKNSLNRFEEVNKNGLFFQKAKNTKSTMLHWNSHPFSPSLSQQANRRTHDTIPALKPLDLEKSTWDVTRQTSMALFTLPSGDDILALSRAFPLVAVVRILFPGTPPATLKPFLMILQILQLGIELQRLEEPLRPMEQTKVVQWKRRRSLPSATQRGCFFGSLVALVLLESLYSSNLDMVLGVLWTLRMTGACFFSQFDWNMISTVFLLVSSGPGSDTEFWQTNNEYCK